MEESWWACKLDKRENLLWKSEILAFRWNNFWHLNMLSFTLFFWVFTAKAHEQKFKFLQDELSSAQDGLHHVLSHQLWGILSNINGRKQFLQSDMVFSLWTGLVSIWIAIISPELDKDFASAVIFSQHVFKKLENGVQLLSSENNSVSFHIWASSRENLSSGFSTR